MKTTIALILAVLFSGISIAQDKPEWVDFETRGKKYHSAFYLTGFAFAEAKAKDDLAPIYENLKNYAKAELIEGLKTTIKTSSIQIMEESDEDVSEYFRRSASSASELEIEGLKTETYFDKKEKKAYAFAYAKKSDLKNKYNQKLQTQIDLLKTTLNTAVEYTKNKNNGDALSTLYKCLNITREIENIQSVLMALDKFNESSNAKEVINLRNEIDKYMLEVNKTPVTNLNQAASFLALALNEQMPNISQQIQLLNLTFQDTKMGSSFARRFSIDLENALTQKTKYAIVTKLNDPNNTPNFLITGTYWEEKEHLKIIVSIKTKTGISKASAETKIPLSYLKEQNINYKPENFEDAFTRMKKFSEGEIISGGLLVDIYTNKGKKNLMFTQGEIMKLFIKANRECYIRIVYHLADGSRVLLIDNYYISNDKINKAVELPYEFECSDPYGVEVLQMNAQTKEFEDINTKQEYGYDFIVDGFDDVLIKTRGFKRVNNKTLKAEKRMIITTMLN